MKHDFCRKLWKEIKGDIKETGHDFRNCWVYKYADGSWEFHGPDNYYSSLGKKADCSPSAKAEGWLRFLENIKTI